MIENNIGYFCTLENFNNIEKKIALRLIDNQNLLKLLYYNGTDALSQPDLNDEQRYSMINQINQEHTKIFFSPYPSNTEEEKLSQIRITVDKITPKNNILSDIVFRCDVIVHNDLWAIDNGDTRPRQLVVEMLKSLNGKEVDGLGLLYFKYDITQQRFSKNHSGYCLFPKTSGI